MQRDTKGKFINGHKHSEETKRKMSEKKIGKRISPKTEFKKGIVPWNKGKKVPQMSGENHPMWKGGVTPKNQALRMSSEQKQWRIQVFERDGYKCQVCGLVGVFLEAHHIKSFAGYPELRLDINNGITLCSQCHSLTDNYKGRQKRENINTL